MRKFLLISGSMVGFIAGNTLAIAQPSSCAGSKTDSQTSRFSTLLGGLGSGLVTSGMQKMGLNPDSSWQGTMRSFLSTGIACALSPKEQKKAADTQVDALDSGKIGSASRRNWKSDEHPNVGGGTLIESRSSEGGKNCAVTQTFITDENGQEKSVQKELCQAPDGKWA